MDPINDPSFGSVPQGGALPNSEASDQIQALPEFGWNNDDIVSTSPIISKRDMIKSVFANREINIHDSEARDNLANERTFLSWLRTSFAISALGIVLIRFQTFSNETTTPLQKIFTKILALTYVTVGLLCVVVGSIRFVHVQILMQRERYPTSGGLTLVVLIFSIILLSLTFALLIIS